MADSDRSLNVPKPVKGRNVTGFSTKAPAATPRLAPAPEPAAAPTRQGRRSAKKTTVRSPGASSMVRVHTTVSVEVATALRDRVDITQQTQTDILAEAMIAYGPSLVGRFDATDRAQYEALGFRRRPPKIRHGRMSATFYMSKLARKSLDKMADDAGFDSRSAFIDAVLRRQLHLPD